MELTNKMLRDKHVEQFFVLLVKKDGVLKYICKSFGHRRPFWYTVLLKQAKRFDSKCSAKKFAEENGILQYEVGTVDVVMSLTL